MIEPQMNKLKRISKICLILFCITIVAFLLDSFFYGEANPLQPSCANTGSNGLWLRYYWYAGKIQAAKEWDDMLEKLRANQIGYAYFHVLTTKADGTLKIHKLENARKITSAVHTGAPKLR
jgi:hypothetical protein